LIENVGLAALALLQMHFFVKAVSLLTLCREDPLWPGGCRKAREKFKGRLPYSVQGSYT
jgi:hypothetical protein